MLKNLIILPDGTELTSGVGQVNNIRSTALTECVNSGEELTIGSACSAMMEVVVQAPRGGLSLTAGDEVTLYKVDDAGARHKVGPFMLEKPTRSSTHLMKLTGYDRVSWLDRDLTAWLKSLTGWPYSLLSFAGMVCHACGLTLVTTSIPNGDYQVQKFSREATGRQLMQWIGEICCRFCRATADGEIEFAWYTPAEVPITPSGDHYYFQRSLTFEDYRVAPIDAVQVKLADSGDGVLIPTVEAGANSYIISGNPILTSVTDDVLAAIHSELTGMTYTPCKVSIPANLDIRAGNTVQITDNNGVTVTAYVMTRTQKGQRDTLECTGSPRRDSSTAQNNRTGQEKTAALATQAYSAANNAVAAQTQADILNKLTNNGELKGFYIQGGKLCIDGEFVQIMNLIANSVISGRLASADGKVFFDLDGGFIGLDEAVGDTGLVKGLRLQEGGMQGAIYDSADVTLCFRLHFDENGSYLVSPAGKPMHFGDADTPLYIGGKAVTWKDNGDGTSTLVGS